jgi:hypothetical protein
MSASQYSDLSIHVGHQLTFVEWIDNITGKIRSVQIECEKCGDILIEFDNPKLNESKNFTTPEGTRWTPKRIKQIKCKWTTRLK